MKVKIRRQGSTEWRQRVVAALATAGASVASGATVQITFLDNHVANTANGGVSNFETDLTGDGLPDVTGSGFESWAGVLGMAGGAVGLGAAWASNLKHYAFAGAFASEGFGNAAVHNLVNFRFSDLRVNNGELTNGWLELSATSEAAGGQYLVIHRLIFDDFSTVAPTGLTWESTGIPEWGLSAVPEPGSNLALLALGAGGLTLRRRLKRAASDGSQGRPAGGLIGRAALCHPRRRARARQRGG